jgi:hypothetical protein
MTIQDQHGLHSEFKDTLVFIASPYLKKLRAGDIKQKIKKSLRGFSSNVFIKLNVIRQLITPDNYKLSIKL